MFLILKIKNMLVDDRARDYYLSNYCNFGNGQINDYDLQNIGTPPCNEARCGGSSGGYTLYNDRSGICKCIYNPPYGFAITTTIGLHKDDLQACLALDRPDFVVKNKRNPKSSNPLYCQQPYLNSSLSQADKVHIDLFNSDHPCYNVYKEYCGNIKNISSDLCLLKFCPNNLNQLDIGSEAKTLCDKTMKMFCETNSSDPLCSCIISSAGDYAACVSPSCVNAGGYKTADQLDKATECPSMCSLINIDNLDKIERLNYQALCEGFTFTIPIAYIFIIIFISVLILFLFILFFLKKRS
jgi:hypothetical protein